VPHVFINAWTSKHPLPLRVEDSSSSSSVPAVAAPAKTSTSASRVALSATPSLERALLHRPQCELMQVVQLGLEKPVLQDPMQELTPQLKPRPRQEAQDQDTPFPTRQFETQVTFPPPGTPKQRLPQLCSLGWLSKRQCPQTWRTRMLNKATRKADPIVILGLKGVRLGQKD